MSKESQTFTLADGRDVGYGEWGDPNGAPVFFFHGTPGSRILTKTFEESANKKGIRLIGTDRPGYGLSTLHEGRTVLDHADDVRQLADHLGVDGFGVAGASGGGPYVFACAHEFPERVFGGLAICTVGPPESFSDEMRQMFEAVAANPEQSEQQMGMMIQMVEADRAGYIKNLLENAITDKWRPLAEQKVHMLEAFVDHHVEGQRNGAAGSLQEQKLILEPWGFDVEDIKVPIRIWVGALDVLAPHAHWLHEKLKDSRLEVVEEAGHIDAMWITDEVLEPLVELVPAR